MQPSANNTALVPKPKAQPPVPIQVLIVDDDPDYLDLLMDQIGQIHGVRVAIARTPQDAVSKLSQYDYDLVVSDWALDSWTAPEVLLRADALIENGAEAKIPVLFISGSEKVSQTQVLHCLRHFEPVSFMLKRCGPPLISLLAEHILANFRSSEPEAVC